MATKAKENGPGFGYRHSQIPLSRHRSQSRRYERSLLECLKLDEVWGDSGLVDTFRKKPQYCESNSIPHHFLEKFLIKAYLLLRLGYAGRYVLKERIYTKESVRYKLGYNQTRAAARLFGFSDNALSLLSTTITCLDQLSPILTKYQVGTGIDKSQ